MTADAAATRAAIPGVPAIRTSARAIIRRGDRLLVVHLREGDRAWCVLPGGGQAHGEELHEALLREVEEEIGVRPVVGALRFVRECIASRDYRDCLPAHFHQVEVFFDCSIDTVDPTGGPAPDRGQIGVAWESITALRRMNFYPQALLDRLDRVDAPVYLGAC